MKLNKLMISVAATFLLSIMPGMSQKKIVIDDRAQFLTEPVESALANRLRSDSVELTSVIDNKKRCEYWFATLIRTGSDINLSVIDCNDRVAGKKNLGTVINSAADSEKALLLYFAVSEIIRNPSLTESKGVGYENNQSIPQPSGLQAGNDTIEVVSDPGQHRSRYFFSPSSYNLEKGELYYNTLYFLVHDLQYGISNQFSMGIGTTIVGLPFYITPKFTMPLNKKSAMALGDMLIIGTYGTRFTGNLVYLTYTRGNAFSNFTVGAGFFTLGGQDISNNVNTPVFNFAALGRISDHIYFITENYFSYNKATRTGYYNNYTTGNYSEETFSQSSFIMYNMIGFRFINKTKDVKCWQIGLSFITGAFEDLPDKYEYDYYTDYTWYTDAPSSDIFWPIPMIAYARKFSTKY
jgi:hypothetical protein